MGGAWPVRRYTREKGCLTFAQAGRRSHCCNMAAGRQPTARQVAQAGGNLSRICNNWPHLVFPVPSRPTSTTLRLLDMTRFSRYRSTKYDLTPAMSLSPSTAAGGSTHLFERNETFPSPSKNLRKSSSFLGIPRPKKKEDARDIRQTDARAFTRGFLSGLTTKWQDALRVGRLRNKNK